MLSLLTLATLAAAELLKLDFTRTTVSGNNAFPLRRRDLGLPIYNDLPHQVRFSRRLNKPSCADYKASDT